MGELTQCLLQGHDVVADVLQPRFLTCTVSLGAERDGKPTAEVNASAPLTSIIGSPSVLSWTCQTCDETGVTSSLTTMLQ